MYITWTNRKECVTIILDFTLMLAYYKFISILHIIIVYICILNQSLGYLKIKTCFFGFVNNFRKQ